MVEFISYFHMFALLFFDYISFLFLTYGSRNLRFYLSSFIHEHGYYYMDGKQIRRYDQHIEIFDDSWAVEGCKIFVIQFKDLSCMK